MDNNGEVVYLYLDDIIPNRFQPREVFDDQALKELAVSIKEHGVIQPIIVRKIENKYEIIAGERRYKASTMAGLTKIPAIVKNLDDKESSKVALIENLQRKDLSPIEEARTYQKILELEDNMTQEQLAATMGKTQSSVSNKLRLLDLPDEIQDALLKDKISERHARSLLSLEDKNDQIKMMDKVVAERMTVRELDKEIKQMKGEVVEEEPAPVQTSDIPPMPTNIGDVQPPVTTAPVNNEITEQGDEVMNNNFNSLTDTLTTNEQIAPIEVSTETPAETPLETPTVAPAELNPTSVDINQIRENSVDINPINPPGMDTSDLMKKEEQEEFKFVPSLTDNTTAATPAVEPAKEENMFAKFFDTNTASLPSENNTTVASSITPVSLAVPSVTPVKDVTPAVNDVKTTITNLQNNGYNVTFEENDNSDEYKITIQIKKN